MEHDSIKKLFGPEAKNYTKYRPPYPRELFDVLIKVAPEGSSSVLDVACGTGKSAEPLASLGWKVCGVDHDQQMIEEAKEQAQKKHLDIDYVIADVERLPFADESFDVITVGTAFHFFAGDAAMSEIKRVLKSQGLLFIYWIVTAKEIPEEDAIPGSIFQKYHWVRVPPKLRDLEYISGFLKGAGFERIFVEKIPITFSSTVEERVGLLTTSGSYELLSGEDKKSFLSEVREVLKRKLGNRSYFDLEEEIQVSYGFKG